MTMTTLDSELTRYLSNATFGLWCHASHWRPGLHWMPDSFEHGKQTVLQTIRELSYPALVERTLFPGYAMYESCVEKAVTRQISGRGEGPFRIPKCEAFPDGGSYKRYVVQLPKNLFQEVDARFANTIDFHLTCIVPQLDENFFFWHNLELNYDRRATMNSRNGHILETVKGSGMLVVSDTIYMENKVARIVPAIMSILLSAYGDYVAISQHPDGFQYVQTSIGKTRYRRNLEELLCHGKETAHQNVGNLIVKADELEKAMKDPKTFATPSCALPEIERYAEDSLNIIVQAYRKTSGYVLLKEMEDLLNETVSQLQPLEEYPICELWNRCVKQKVRTKEQLVESLRSKCQAVIQKGLTLLSMHFIKEKTASAFYLI